MIEEVLCLFTGNIHPEVYRLRNVSVYFFILWIIDIVVGICCECLILHVNACVVFNTWVSIAAAALSQHHNRESSALLPILKNEKGLQGTTHVNSLTRSTQKQQQQQQREEEEEGQQQQQVFQSGAESSQGFLFGLRRLHVLISFGSMIFVMFNCLTVIGESLQHALHPHDSSPLLLLLVGVFHVVMFTIYAREIDANDRISGIGFGQKDMCIFRVEKATHPSLWPLRCLGGILRPMLYQNGIFRCATRVFAPLTCIALCLVVMVCNGRFCEVVGALLLAVYVFSIAFRRAKELGWLLVNNSVRKPSVVAQCDRAIRSVKLVDGVLQVQSFVFWELDEGQIMALVHIRLMSTANLTDITLAVRRILEGVSTFVFVEAHTSHEDDNASDAEEELGEQQWHDSHGHHHEGDGCHHAHDGKEERQRATNTNGHDLTETTGEAGFLTSPTNMPSFPKPPNFSAVGDHAMQHTHSRVLFGGGISPILTTQQHFNIVPPPFPKPPM